MHVSRNQTGYEVARTDTFTFCTQTLLKER